MQRIPALLIIVAIAGSIFMSCQKDTAGIALRVPALPAQLANYAVPDMSPGFWIDQQRYKVTDAGATLGRVLVL
jgi:hypothetical protein